MGISEELLPRIFDMFTQAERALDRSQGGLGIGLTLVRRLVELHGGSILAHSAGPGKGSEFVVRLPLGRHEHLAPQVCPAAEAPPSPPLNQRPSRRVLVVE